MIDSKKSTRLGFASGLFCLGAFFANKPRGSRFEAFVKREAADHNFRMSELLSLVFFVLVLGVRYNRAKPRRYMQPKFRHFSEAGKAFLNIF